MLHLTRGSIGRTAVVLIFGLTFFLTKASLAAATSSSSKLQPNQQSFNSPGDAAAALVSALRSRNWAAVQGVLGVKAKHISSGDPIEDRADIDAFLKNYDRMHRFANGPDGKYYLIVGAENWPMPFPLAVENSKWFFDTIYGEKELNYRRIGRDEFDAIKVCREIVSAQQQYYSGTHDGQSHQYAAKILSDAGKQNGLFWRATDGVKPSPIGPLIAAASEAGYRAAQAGQPQQYYGYRYRMLAGQGPSAPGGARSYVQDGKVTGFALLAYPAKYGDSGVMTFIVGPDGIVYERDLGPQTESQALLINQFDPDSSWHKVEAE